MKKIVSLAAPFTAAAVFTIASAQAAELAGFADFDGRWSSDQSVATMGFMLPLYRDAGQTFFIDVSGSLVEDNVRRGALGAAYRFDAGHGVTLGFNGYYDYLNSSLDNSFHQLSFGGELLGSVFEARANAYVPFGDGEAVDGAGAGVIDDGALRFREGREQARPGADIEAGFKVPGVSDEGNTQLKFFAGSYWYGGKNVSDMFGGKLRAELAFGNMEGLPAGSTISFGATASYDNEDKLGGELMARLRIPFGAPDGPPVDAFDPATLGVKRASAIKTHVGATGDIEDAVLEMTGQAAGKVLTLTPENSDAAAINARLAEAGTGAIILADGNLAFDTSLALGNGQVLLGGGGQLALYGASSRSRGSFVNTGAATTLTGNDPTRDVVTMASGSTISTVAIAGGLAGIGSTDTSDLLIDNVDIFSTAHDGIRLSSVNGAVIQNSKIHDLYICENNTLCEFSVFTPNAAPYAAVSAHGTKNLTVRNTTIDDVTYGVFAGSAIETNWPPVITDLASNITLDNVTISRSRREGVLLVAADNVNMNKVTIDNSEQDRDMDLVVLQGASNVSITDMALKGGINGLMLVSSASLPDEAKTKNVKVDGLTIDGTRNAGIFFNPVGDISLKDVRITNAGTYGMFVYGDEWGFLGGPVNNVSFESIVIDKATSAGLYFMGPSENLTGAITVINTPHDCYSDPSWLGGLSGSITQPVGSALLVNGEELNGSTFDNRCG